MFILDSNILSAMMGAQPVPEVAAWIAGQQEDLLFTAAICEAEILSGLAIMPEGRRRRLCRYLRHASARRSADGDARPHDRRRRAGERGRRGHARYWRFRRVRPHARQSMGGNVTEWVACAAQALASFAEKREQSYAKRSLIARFVAAVSGAVELRQLGAPKSCFHARKCRVD